MIAMILVSGERRLIERATPLNAGAKAECQNGRITTSTASLLKIIFAVFRQEFGDMESSGATADRGGVEVPDFVWAKPGKNIVGY